MDTEIDRIRGALTGALSPTSERGQVALIYGGTADTRRGCLDALSHALERAGSPHPLVVRVGAATAGARLPERITDAVEGALEARRAPGGLYEDSGEEVVRSLGAWLFRARSVGFAGLVLLVDEVDGHLDARGRSDEPLQRWFAALLSACATRAVSVAVTARSADASGAPSLPHDLVDRFALREPLGGPSTVLARDPSTLVAALAGRTFSRASLYRALDTWLDLPTGDEDAVLVFSSPLAPPSMPRFAPAEEPSLRPPLRSDVRPASRHEPSGEGDLASWSDALTASVELAGAIRAGRAHALSDRESVEATFRASYSRIPRRVERVARGASQVGVEAPAMIRRGGELMSRLDAALPTVCSLQVADEPSLPDLVDLCAAHAAAISAKLCATVLLTGMRADLGETFAPRVLARIPGARVVAEGLRWTMPASPERARALAELVDQSPWEDALHPHRERVEGREVYRVSAYAKSLLAGARGLDEAAARVEGELADALRSWLSGWSGPVALLFVSDVGVGGANARGERALGDGSAFARIVPWWIVTVGAAV